MATEKIEGIAAGLRRIGGLSGGIERRLQEMLTHIEDINLQTRLLSFNAQIEATHAGAAGRAFEVVAREMVALSTRTSDAARKLEADTSKDVIQLNDMVEAIGAQVRGMRLADLAHTNIDLIDRNLYERSCDVRWWATDSSCIEALAEPSRAAHASRRLGQILDSYTVYFDIVLCDLTGAIIANGRPEKYPCAGTRHAGTAWFQSALATRSGAEFGFQGLHRSPNLAGGKMILVYSAAVREGGRPDGRPLGCLGIVFDWESLAQTIVTRTQVGEAERRQTRVCLVDTEGRVLADNQNKHLQEVFPLADFKELVSCGKGYVVTTRQGTRQLAAYARSPGYETYATGWHSFILQPLDLGGEA